MPSWVIGFLLGFLMLNNALALSQPLSALNALVGVFLWGVILVNWYGKD
jgi:hypothetical protein